MTAYPNIYTLKCVSMGINNNGMNTYSVNNFSSWSSIQNKVMQRTKPGRERSAKRSMLLVTSSNKGHEKCVLLLSETPNASQGKKRPITLLHIQLSVTKDQLFSDSFLKYLFQITLAAILVMIFEPFPTLCLCLLAEFS